MPRHGAAQGNGVGSLWPVRASEIVGGLSVIGVIALIGFAIAEDNDPETITTPSAPTILAPLDSTTTAPVEPTPTEPPTTSADAETDTTDATSDTTEATEPAATSTTPTTAAPSTTEAPPTLAPEDREAVRVRVVNAGGVVGAATFATGILEGEGFVPENPGDGVENAEANTIFYAPGQELAAAAVNESINAQDDRVIEADDDRNWEEFGSELDVLVVLGPE